MEPIFLKVSLVLVAVVEVVDAEAVLAVLLEVALVLRSVGPLVSAETVFQIVGKFAFISVIDRNMFIT